MQRFVHLSIENCNESSIFDRNRQCIMYIGYSYLQGECLTELYLYMYMSLQGLKHVLLWLSITLN